MDADTQKKLARTNGIGRAVIGATLTLAPALATRGWIGDKAASGPGGQVLGRALGIRDLVIGAGLLWAQDRKEPEHAWLVAAAAADTVDAAATLLNWNDLPKAGRIAILAIAAGSAVQMGLLAAQPGA
jgi:hypothetical protein